MNDMVITMQDRDQLGGKDTVVKKVLEALEEEGIDTTKDRECDRLLL